MPFRSVTVLAIAAIALVLPARASADAIFNVTLDTGSLAGAPGSPFSLFFQLTDGSGTGDGNNTVTLSGFDFGGGAIDPGTTLADGGVTGDFATGISMTDSSFFNFLLQGFTPGTLLSFVVNMTTNPNAGGLPPDAFAFSMLDAAGAPIPTLDPNLADTLLTINIDSLTPIPQSFGNDPSRTDLVVRTPQVTTVPEPATLGLMASGIGLAGLARWRKRRRR